MRLRRRFSAEARKAAADTEQTLVSALQESDTPAELLRDEIEDDVEAVQHASDRRKKVAAASALALLTLLVIRRKR
jgi:hypothetical protein